MLISWQHHNRVWEMLVCLNCVANAINGELYGETISQPCFTWIMSSFRPILCNKNYTLACEHSY